MWIADIYCRSSIYISDIQTGFLSFQKAVLLTNFCLRNFTFLFCNKLVCKYFICLGYLPVDISQGFKSIGHTVKELASKARPGGAAKQNESSSSKPLPVIKPTPSFSQSHGDDPTSPLTVKQKISTLEREAGAVKLPRMPSPSPPTQASKRRN